MATPPPNPSMFNLDGTFLEFVGDQPTKAKAIHLEVEGEVLTIKLRKELRPMLRSRLQPGDYLRCIGRTKVDGTTNTLKARQVFTLLPPLPKPCSPSQSPNPPSESPAQEGKQPHSPLHHATPPLKIQVCHKSGCQKRGGRQLAAALEQALRQRNLQGQVTIQYTGCQKHCSKAPTFTVMPGGHRYSQVKISQLPTILDRHLSPAKPTPM